MQRKTTTEPQEIMVEERKSKGFLKLLQKLLTFFLFYFGWAICLERAVHGDPWTGP